MHLVVPFAAGLSEPAAQALQTLRLTHLERLLSRLQPGTGVDGDEYALNLPHEHLLARARGGAADDGRLPLAALAARGEGLAVPAGSGWGLLQPSHWQVGREQIVLRDPAELMLDDYESRALFAAASPLFASEGWALHWSAPTRWFASHPSLATLATASLDRVIGRNLDLWLPDRLAGRQVRRLQSEVQMLWHGHPVNEAREARGALPVNSFWLWGTGAAPAEAPASPERAAADGVVDDRLRAPWLAEDWAAWAEAWQTLDREALAALDRDVAAGAPVSLTLAGERRAARFDAVAAPGWKRLLRGLRRASAHDLLATL
jgi:hypothetical protein